MNDTTRDELLATVEDLIAEAKSHTGQYTDAYAHEIIALVTAARDAEIRSALLSSSMHDAVDEHLYGVVANGWLREVYRAGLDHIGLHGDGMGGMALSPRQGNDDER